jgi:hypothetical protein
VEEVEVVGEVEGKGSKRAEHKKSYFVPGQPNAGILSGDPVKSEYTKKNL